MQARRGKFCGSKQHEIALQASLWRKMHLEIDSIEFRVYVLMMDITNFTNRQFFFYTV